MPRIRFHHVPARPLRGLWLVTLAVLVWTATGRTQPLDLLQPRSPISCRDDSSGPAVSLALAGGGARGIAHIGVLRALEKQGIAVDLICGVSMGAIIGGLYAAGISTDSLEALVRQVDWDLLLKNTPSRAGLLLSQKDEGADWLFSLPLRGITPVWPTGATSGQVLYNYLTALTQRATYLSQSDFDRLRVRYRAVSTDLISGERIVLDQGGLAAAMRASMAFPLAVSPLKLDGYMLADGGLIDPLPVFLADSLSDCPVVAVNTASGMSPAEKLDDPYALANQATTVMTSERLTRSWAAADFRCEPVRDELSNVDFARVDSLITLGYRAGRALADEILADLRRGPRPPTPAPQESMRHAVDTVMLSGASVLADSVLRAALALPPDQQYTVAELRAAISRLESAYTAREFSLAAVTHATLDTAGALRITVDEARLAGIELVGIRTVKSWVILRSFPLKIGTPFNAARMARGLADMHASGLFEQVTSEIVHSPQGPVVRLTVTEKSTDALRLGLHHNLEYQTEGFIQWAKTNLFGLGNELTAHAQYAPRRTLYFARVKSDRIFRTYLTASLRLYYYKHERYPYRDHERLPSFVTTRDGVEFSIGQNISRFAQMALLVGAENVDYEIDSTETEYRHSRIAAVARLDDLDHAEFPTRGRRLTAQLSWGDDFFDGDLVYRAFTADGEWFHSPAERLTLSIGARFGSADRVMPIFERFSLGGRRSFMGLADDELLGDRLVAGSLGARYRVLSFGYGTARLDLGNAWSKGSDIDFWGELRAGIGAGMLFETPLGPLAIAYGLADRGHTKFYFSWGHEF